MAAALGRRGVDVGTRSTDTEAGPPTGDVCSVYVVGTDSESLTIGVSSTKVSAAGFAAIRTVLNAGAKLRSTSVAAVPGVRYPAFRDADDIHYVLAGGRVGWLELNGTASAAQWAKALTLLAPHLAGAAPSKPTSDAACRALTPQVAAVVGGPVAWIEGAASAAQCEWSNGIASVDTDVNEVHDASGAVRNTYSAFGVPGSGNGTYTSVTGRDAAYFPDVRTLLVAVDADRVLTVRVYRSGAVSSAAIERLASRALPLLTRSAESRNGLCGHIDLDKVAAILGEKLRPLNASSDAMYDGTAELATCDITIGDDTGGWASVDVKVSPTPVSPAQWSALRASAGIGSGGVRALSFASGAFSSGEGLDVTAYVGGRIVEVDATELTADYVSTLPTPESVQAAIKILVPYLRNVGEPLEQSTTRSCRTAEASAARVLGAGVTYRFADAEDGGQERQCLWGAGGRVVFIHALTQTSAALELGQDRSVAGGRTIRVGGHLAFFTANARHQQATIEVLVGPHVLVEEEASGFTRPNVAAMQKLAAGLLSYYAPLGR